MKITVAAAFLLAVPYVSGNVSRELAKTERKTRKTKSGKKTRSSKPSKKSKKSKSSKSPRDFANVLEEYDQLDGIRLSFSGLPELLDPTVVMESSIHNFTWNAATEEALTVECSTLCNTEEKEGKKCTTFMMVFFPQDSGAPSGCVLLNSDANKFNPAQKVAFVSGPVVGRRVSYHNKLALPLQSGESTVTEGLFPTDQASADFMPLAYPAVACVGGMGGEWQDCENCLVPNLKEKSCRDVSASVCGFGKSGEGDPAKGFFLDETCGTKCFSGETNDFACLAKLQTFALAIFNQRYAYLPGFGYVFGCATSNIADAITGTALPDYTCPPNPDQAVAGGE